MCCCFRFEGRDEIDWPAALVHWYEKPKCWIKDLISFKQGYFGQD
jgi:hypothetical protein